MQLLLPRLNLLHFLSITLCRMISLSFTLRPKATLSRRATHSRRDMPNHRPTLNPRNMLSPRETLRNHKLTKDDAAFPTGLIPRSLRELFRLGLPAFQLNLLPLLKRSLM